MDFARRDDTLLDDEVNDDAHVPHDENVEKRDEPAAAGGECDTGVACSDADEWPESSVSETAAISAAVVVAATRCESSRDSRMEVACCRALRG